jgi:primosomal protein N' (replication factor Y) (superfamily II helicase)
MFIEIAFPLPLQRTFHYRLPQGAEPRLDYVGRRALAPFGKRALVGYVVGTQGDTPNFPTKPITNWIDTEPLLGDDLLDLAKWISETYLCSLGEALSVILPTALSPAKRPQTGKKGEEKSDENRKSADPIELSPEQKKVLAPILSVIESKTYRPFLLRGVTNSGKTELYLRAIDHAIAQKQQSIFLLPEIALTPPFIDRLKSRYSEAKVGVWHSGISPAARYDTWLRARRGELDVVVGARSAVFAPFPNLGVVIMDEEHESSYKQEERPRYHTREVALKRAEQAGAVVVMGSATPSLESYTSAKSGIYQLLELTSRVEEKQLPQVTLIDRRTKSETPEPKKRARASSFDIFSEPLRLAIEKRLARKEQVLLFVNRRGFTPFLRCSKCGWVARCERCSMTLTEHRPSPPAPLPKQGEGGRRPGEGAPVLQCHSCSRSYPMVIECPSCKSMRLSHFGVGTQRVEQEMKRLFPFVKMARLDRDVSQKRGAYEKIFRAFEAHKLDVLVGTQVIAKGFDFPKVTLVGVVDADATLHLPDFRAAERTFQLITQVAGRTGRGKHKGEVFVQTHHAEHAALQAAEKHDYLRFYEQEIADRQLLNYPPFCELVYIILRTTKETAVQKAAEDLFDKLEKLNGGAELLGPAPAPYARLRNQYRYQILIKGNKTSLATYLNYLRSYRPSKAYMSVDINPTDLL